MKKKPNVPLRDLRIHVRFKLSALWTATVLCFIYGDLFGFFRQQTMTSIVSGKAGAMGSQGGLLAAAVSVALPSLMVMLSLILNADVSRGLNVTLGAAFTMIVLATMPGAWAYYLFLSVIEVCLTASIVWYAWHWPKLTLAPDRTSQVRDDLDLDA